MTKKRLAIFLDGTWNTPDSQTNVHRLYSTTLNGTTADGIAQRTFYRTGVGTRWNDRFRGGAFGMGLSANVLEAYRWLVEQYDDGDEIYLVGFSRGAYTARSLGGMIAKCGLLRRGGSMTVEDIHARYQKGKDAATIYDLLYLQQHNTRPLTVDEQQLLAQSRRVEIMALGVWDTVGALGIPSTAVPFWGKKDYYFLNTNPSNLYQYCYHALAINEHREAYRPTFWTRFTRTLPQQAAVFAPPPHIEQRWFAGAHANVGGGYAGDTLCRPPLAWMQDRLGRHGLAFTERLTTSAQDLQGDNSVIRDSFMELLKGLYAATRLFRRYYRTIGADSRQANGGWSTSLGEVIDASAFEKYRINAHRQFDNLEDWARRRGVDLATHAGDHPA